MLCPIASCTKLIGDVISEVWFVTVKYAIALDTIFACELISTFVLLSASYLATFSLYLSDSETQYVDYTTDNSFCDVGRRKDE